MLVTDAVCVRYLSEKEVLAGVGNQLQYFYVKDQVTFKKVCVKRTTYKISQITFFQSDSGKKSETKLIAAAGPELLVTCIRNNAFNKAFIFKLNDWINSVCFDAVRHDGRIFCVTAHNRASEISVDFCQEEAVVLRRSRCLEVSTAYSSLIYGEAWESLLLLAGTAFGELIIWSPCNPEDKYDIGTILLRIPHSHNGVIFDIQLNLEASLLTTCSDDRSVQLWKFTYNKQESTVPSLEKIKRCFAHVCRVFRSKIIKNEESFYILSIGEDSHVCLWDNLGCLVYKKFLENCGTIWGLDYFNTIKTVVVVTNNGRLIKIPLAKELDGESTKIEVIDPSGSSIAKLKYLSLHRLLVCLTETNQILVYDVKDVGKIKITFHLEAGHKYCMMETYKEFVYFVTTESRVIVYEFLPKSQEFLLMRNEKVSWNSNQRSMIRSLIPLNDGLLLICSNNGLTWVTNSLTLENSSEFRIPKCSEPWVTSAISTESGFLIGDRCGHLHLFKIGYLDPIHSLRRLHGNMGITQILKVDSRTFKTTGHDGSVRTVVLENDESLKHTFTQKISNINFIERCHGQFSFGFSSSFFICHHSRDGTLIEHNCGGGNRQYDLLLGDLERYGTLSLAVIQQRKVKQVTFKVKLSNETPLEFPDIRWHHLSCNYLTVVQTETFSLVISGGEDTLLKIYEIDLLSKHLTDEPNLRLLRTSSQHNSAIKSIISTRVKPEGDLIVISVGSRAKICITRIRSLMKGLSIEEETQFMLYEDNLIHAKDQSISFDPESSFTSAVLVKSLKKEDILVCGCSDGYLRLFRVLLEANPITISLEKEIFYGKSILHVKTVFWDDFTLIISMGTDGIINFWNFNELSQGVIYQLKHHDSGIHAYDIKEQGAQILIGTGGDDQSVVISRVKLRKNVESLVFETQKTFFIPDLHTAQVTGVRFLSDQILLTVGVDQMIYEVIFDKDLDQKVLKKSYWTSIEDAKGLVYFRDKIIVYGNGIEML